MCSYTNIKFTNLLSKDCLPPRILTNFLSQTVSCNVIIMAEYIIASYAAYIRMCVISEYNPCCTLTVSIKIAHMRTYIGSTLWTFV